MSHLLNKFLPIAMLWSPNEVLAYLKEDVNLQKDTIDKREKKMISKNLPFGGFPLTSVPEHDFIFIAENSEIFGPNPLFTIPCQPKDIDLNLLSTRILSADYQGLSCKKTVSLSHAQLLMPDVSKNIHAVVNYFLLFDTEARGFIRPICIAYITSDKYKLLRTAETVLKVLSEASMMLQHSNMLNTVDNLKAMLQEINSQCTGKMDIQKKMQNEMTEGILKDMPDNNCEEEVQNEVNLDITEVKQDNDCTEEMQNEDTAKDKPDNSNMKEMQNEVNEDIAKDKQDNDCKKMQNEVNEDNVKDKQDNDCEKEMQNEMTEDIGKHLQDADYMKQMQNKVTEDIAKDIQDIIDVIESYEGNYLFDKQLSAILEKMKKTSTHSELAKIFNFSSESMSEIPQWKNKNRHSHKKNMKSLFLMCGSGLILGLYHLYMMYKHVRRKYENIYITQTFDHEKENDERLYFGACVKNTNVNSSVESFPPKDCTLNVTKYSKVPSLDSEQYFLSIDEEFEKVLLDFLNWESNTHSVSKQKSSFLQSSDISDNSTEPESLCSSSSGYLSYENEQTERFKDCTCGHIVTLENVWDILDDLQKENPDIEAEFLEILKLFDDTKRLLFSVLTRTPVVIISTPEERVTAQNFIKALSVFIPRRKDEILVVDLDRQEPYKTDSFENIAALNICLQNNQDIETIIPEHISHSLCILSLKDCSMSAPPYTGILLNNIDERFRMLPLDGPAFPIFVGIICEIQSTVEWWLMVTKPSVDSSAAASSSLSKGFSRLDVQILLELSKLCRSQ